MMEHHNKPVLWIPDSDQSQTTIRQPRSIPSNYSIPQQATQANSIQLNNLNAALNEPMKLNSEQEKLAAKSNLRAEASEWFPSRSNIQNVNDQVELVTSGVQNRLKLYKTQSVKDQRVDDAGDNSNEYSHDFNRLKQIISTLTRDPGQFHNLFDLFMETLGPYFEDIVALSHASEIIVDQAINHPNFRYTGARLCWFIEQGSPQFRAELHLKCKKQIEENPDTKNVLPLIAELYSQLPHLNVYGTLLISAFKRLIEAGGNDNIKCICQALKLTGYLLERSNKSDLDKVFSDLKTVRGRVDGSACFLLESVFHLRSSNWGHSLEENVDEPEQDNDNLSFDGVENKVFYDLDGEGLTNEESEFIAAHMNASDDFDSDESDPDELYDPEPEMDEEIQEAFKDFVRLGGKH